MGMSERTDERGVEGQHSARSQRRKGAEAGGRGGTAHSGSTPRRSRDPWAAGYSVWSPSPRGSDFPCRVACWRVLVVWCVCLTAADDDDIVGLSRCGGECACVERRHTRCLRTCKLKGHVGAGNNKQSARCLPNRDGQRRLCWPPAETRGDRQKPRPTERTEEQRPEGRGEAGKRGEGGGNREEEDGRRVNLWQW
jgi:hypothetical protein